MAKKYRMRDIFIPVAVASLLQSLEAKAAHRRAKAAAKARAEAKAKAS